MTLVGGGGGRGAKEATFPDPNNFKANLYDMIVDRIVILVYGPSLSLTILMTNTKHDHIHQDNNRM